MNKFVIFFGIPVTLALVCSGVAGQRIQQNEPPNPPSLTRALPLDTAFSEHPSLKNRIATAVAGAAIGAGLGFFASQVAQSDWDEDGGRIHRSTWAAIGGAGGFVLGFSVPMGGYAPGGGSLLPGGSQDVISREQILEASVSTALEAIRLFHPEWLILRGQESFNDPDSDTIRVYIDNVHVGSIEALREMSTVTVESIRFWSAQRATARWGSGHTHGAIQVVTMG